jgi:hypothetical protein
MELVSPSRHPDSAPIWASTNHQVFVVFSATGAGVGTGKVKAIDEKNHCQHKTT